MLREIPRHDTVTERDSTVVEWMPVEECREERGLPSTGHPADDKQCDSAATQMAQGKVGQLDRT